jgi:hypothetical protein
MHNFNPAEFGTAFHQFVTAEWEMLGFLAPYLHILTIIVLVLVFIYGNRFKMVFIIYFTLEWLLLFGYWGIYGIIYWWQKDILFLAMFIACPVLLGFIVWQWIREIIKPGIDLDYHRVKYWRWPVLLIAIWGFWYPAYVWGQGFVLQAKDLLFSNYGLMPCPTTMVVLSLLTLNYPRGNRTLFNLLSIFSVVIGIGSVASGWLPDIPFIILGVYGAVLILLNRPRVM